MTDNLLKLNGDKTELLISLYENIRESINIENISLDTVLIEPSDSIRNLGAYFNVPLDHTDFINQKCKSARSRGGTHYHRVIHRCRKRDFF